MVRDGLADEGTFEKGSKEGGSHAGNHETRVQAERREQGERPVYLRNNKGISVVGAEWEQLEEDMSEYSSVVGADDKLHTASSQQKFGFGSE